MHEYYFVVKKDRLIDLLKYIGVSTMATRDEPVTVKLKDLNPKEDVKLQVRFRYTMMGLEMWEFRFIGSKDPKLKDSHGTIPNKNAIKKIISNLHVDTDSTFKLVDQCMLVCTPKY